MYIPLNKKNFNVGDNVTCIENRYARTYNYKNGLKTYTNDTIKYLTLEKEYKVLGNDSKRKKILITGDDNVKYNVPYYRMGIIEIDEE